MFENIGYYKSCSYIVLTWKSCTAGRLPPWVLHMGSSTLYQFTGTPDPCFQSQNNVKKSCIPAFPVVTYTSSSNWTISAQAEHQAAKGGEFVALAGRGRGFRTVTHPHFNVIGSCAPFYPPFVLCISWDYIQYFWNFIFNFQDVQLALTFQSPDPAD